MSIPNDAVVTYVGRWPRPRLISTVGLTGSASEYVATVSAIIVGAGLVIRNSSFESSLLGGVPFDGLRVTLSIQIENGMGFDKPDDIISILRSAVQNVSGNYPLSNSIPYITIMGKKEFTGEPDTSNPSGDTACAGTRDANGNFNLECLLRSITQKGSLILGLVGIGILALFLVIAMPRK